MNSVVRPSVFASRQDEACNLLANLALSISEKVPVPNDLDFTILVPYLVNASSSWAKTFVGLEIPIPKRFTSLQFVKTFNERRLIVEQTAQWTFSISDNSVEASDYTGNRTSMQKDEDPCCIAENGSKSYLQPGDKLERGALRTEVTARGDLIVNDIVLRTACGDHQSATRARYSAVAAASRLVDLSVSKPRFKHADITEHKICSTYVQLEIIKQYCASLWLVKDAQSLSFAQSALESLLSCATLR